MKSFKFLYPILIIILLFMSCEKDNTSSFYDYNNLNNLPLDTDTAGIQTANYLDEMNAPYGYYIYKPSTHDSHPAKYPLLVFLHGKGEIGNSQSDTNALSKVLRNGPPKLIKKGKWNPTYPMIVASPQCHDGSWKANKVHDFIDIIVKENKVNVDRIYLTGLSMGGYGTWSYIQTYADTGFVVAAVPICGGGSKNKAEQFRNIPVWAFHGDADKVVGLQNSINMVEAINALDAQPNYKAKLTVYPGVKHNSWSRTYDGSGMGQERDDYDPFEQNIYDWFFKYRKK